MKHKFWDVYNPVAFAVASIIIFVIGMFILLLTHIKTEDSIDFDKMTYHKNKDGLCFGVIDYKSTQIVYIPCDDLKM